MATRIFTRLYDNPDDATHIIQALETMGIDLSPDISAKGR
jgi:hypothetical protein